MASSEHGIGSNGREENIDRTGTIIEYSEKETTLKREKARAKSNVIRVRNKLLAMIEEEELPSRRAVQDACSSLDSWMENAMETMASLSDLYIKHKELEKGKKVVIEMEKLEDEFSTASETAREYLDSRRDDRSSVTSEILSIDLVHKLNISDHSQTYTKQDFNEVRVANSEVNISDSTATENVQSNIRSGTYENAMASVQNDRSSQWPDIETCMQHQPTQTEDTAGNESTMNPKATPFEPSASCAVPSIGQDLWRQLKRVQIPVFSGDKRSYQSWKAAFLACIDSAPATGEYKLLQLRQYLSGEALKVIENLGHSATAYEAAKERLERKYGGRRRQIAIYLEELDQFRQVRPGSAKDLEKFADLLDIAIINLQEAGQNQELGDGSLYAKLQRKLPEAMLARYHRWIFENNKPESVFTLRTWVIQESEFQTIASETVHGLTGKVANDSPANLITKYKNQRTFFGDTKDSRDMQKLPCKVCGRKHGVWNCTEFIQKSVPDRWDIAKQFQLCFRCLADGHHGKSCPRSRQCGQNDCKQLHHKLLHRPEVTRPLLPRQNVREAA